MPAEPCAQAPPVHQKMPCLQCLRQETAVYCYLFPGLGSSCLASCCSFPRSVLHLADEGVAGGDGEGVAGGDLYLSTWCQILLSYWPLQVKWPSTRSPLVLPSHSQEGLTVITMCQVNLCDPCNVGETPPADRSCPDHPRESREPWQAAHSQLILQPSLPSLPLSFWARPFWRVWTSMLVGRFTGNLPGGPCTLIHNHY